MISSDLLCKFCYGILLSDLFCMSCAMIYGWLNNLLNQVVLRYASDSWLRYMCWTHALGGLFSLMKLGIIYACACNLDLVMVYAKNILWRCNRCHMIDMIWNSRLKLRIQILFLIITIILLILILIRSGIQVVTLYNLFSSISFESCGAWKCLDPRKICMVQRETIRFRSLHNGVFSLSSFSVPSCKILSVSCSSRENPHCGQPSLVTTDLSKPFVPLVWGIYWPPLFNCKMARGLWCSVFSELNAAGFSLGPLIYLTYGTLL